MDSMQIFIIPNLRKQPDKICDLGQVRDAKSIAICYNKGHGNDIVTFIFVIDEGECIGTGQKQRCIYN